MGFKLQAAGPGAIVSIVLLSMVLVIRITGFFVLQYGRWKYQYFEGRLNGSKKISVILTIRNSKDPNLIDYVWAILKNKPEQLLITTNNRKAQHRVDGSPIIFRTKLTAQPRFKQQFEVEPCLNRRHGVHKADEYLFFNRYLLQEEAPREEPCLVIFQDTPEATVLVDRPSIAEFISEYLWMTRNLWRLSRVMIRGKERNQYPCAFLLTHLSSFVSFPLMYEILFFLLVHFTVHLGDDEWAAWIIFGYSLTFFLTVVGAQIIRRFVVGGDYGFGIVTPNMAVLVGYPAYYILGLLRLVALATAWKADIELISEDEIKVRVGDPEALRYSVRGAEEARTDIDEPPWIPECMELERPRRVLRPLRDFPLYVIEE
ncbi:hypothetical protein FPRO06_04404 [Fusarium proliferatum]|nr:hypothetical protein FPRO03_05787 [Fusarium proliferatum]KAG4268507.1 hypothetical protein FPRO04_03596 [Fusarium proliferatum]KAG4289582.1 hypothetical protein FPRO06_04404 [Fusarium proliferatum]KAI1062312.1 hypothetical protein LB506_006079 [Fusarium annulatum]